MCLLCKIKPEYKRQAANAVKPLMSSNNNNQNNNSYGSIMDNKWQLNDQLTRTPLISSFQACKTEYAQANPCFQFSPNAMVA